jgi:Fe-S cluster biogenesis protein NfuA
LSYHLDHLEGLFLRSTGSGYELNRAGEDVVRAILVGSFTETPSFDPLRLSGDCPGCPGSTFEATYDDDLLTVRCVDCEMRIVTYDLPPAAVVGRDGREVLASCDRRARNEYAVAVRGTCSKCGGSTTVRVEEREAEGRTDPYAVASCDRCRNEVFAPLGVRVLSHPAVVSFYWARGVDATEVPFWDVSRYVREWDVEVASTDPLSASVTVRYDGDALSLRLSGGDGGVVVVE